ncbi:MAG: hypothetical protein GY725_24005 [bacterium]|nr:hypothetical protein [bacterium]
MRLALLIGLIGLLSGLPSAVLAEVDCEKEAQEPRCERCKQNGDHERCKLHGDHERCKRCKQTGDHERCKLHDRHKGHDCDHRHRFDLALFDWESNPDERRIQVLDLFLVSLLDARRHGTDNSHIEVLTVPFIKGFESRRSADRRELRVLDLPLASLFEMERDGDDSHLGVLNLPLIGSLFSQRIEDGHRHTNVLFLMHFKRPSP